MNMFGVPKDTVNTTMLEVPDKMSRAALRQSGLGEKEEGGREERKG
jgi:hypothetical protein